jgi:hypothetical protein
VATVITPDFTNLGYTAALPATPQGDKAYWQRIAQNWMRSANQGKIAATGRITLPTDTNATTVLDARAGAVCSIQFMPTTEHAAVEWRYLVVIHQMSGQFTIEHRVLTYTDVTYVYAILG